MAVQNTTVRLEILNAALVRLGERTVTAFTESGPATVLYDQVRLAFLERFPWSFATFRQQLAQLAPGVNPDPPNEFALPSQPAFIRGVNNEETIPPVPYQIETRWNAATQSAVRSLVTHADEVVLTYIGDVDESLWSPLARLAMSKHLAAELSTQITGKQSLRQILVAEAALATSEAIVSDQAGDTPKRAEIDARYLIARRSSAGYDPDRANGVTVEDVIV